MGCREINGRGRRRRGRRGIQMGGTAWDQTGALRRLASVFGVAIRERFKRTSLEMTILDMI